MTGHPSALSAIVERLIEQTKKKNPGVNIMKEKQPKPGMPMPHRDPQNDVEKVVRRYIGYHLRCNLCGSEFVLHRGRLARKYTFQKGWKQWHFCSAECLAKFKEEVKK